MTPTTHTNPVPNTIIPDEIKGWNWGAFLLTWIWGIGNNTLIALLMFIPLVNIVMPFVLGAKGNAWAWTNKKWESVEAFKATQRKWAIAGVVVFVSIIAFVSLSIVSTLLILRQIEPVQASFKMIQDQPEVQTAFGPEITLGFWVSGSISTTGPSGSANLSYSIQGSQDAGTVYVEAHKELGEWVYDALVIERDSDHQRLRLR